MLKTVFVIFGLVALSTCQVPEQEVLISLFATGLTGCDSLSACDAQVKIMCSSANSDWSQCGITSEIKDDNFPVWPERFTFHFKSEDRMRWRFDIVDKDVLIDDPIGSVGVIVEDFLVATPEFNSMRFDIPNGRGTFYVHHRQPQ